MAQQWRPPTKWAKSLVIPAKYIQNFINKLDFSRDNIALLVHTVCISVKKKSMSDISKDGAQAEQQDNIYEYGASCRRLKVSKKFWMSSFEPKNERKYFCISALASKMGQIVKTMAHYHANYLSSNIIICILFLI